MIGIVLTPSYTGRSLEESGKSDDDGVVFYRGMGDERLGWYGQIYTIFIIFEYARSKINMAKKRISKKEYFNNKRS